jgi:hypothetical protein
MLNFRYSFLSGSLRFIPLICLPACIRQKEYEHSL